MFQIIREGTLDGPEEAVELALQFSQIVIPNAEGNEEDMHLTNYWVIQDNGVEMLYIGTPESFALYTQEENGGIQ